jgi:hypothetical protein
MKTAEIVHAIDNGSKVYWQCPSYEVIRGAVDSEYYIKSLATGHCIKLLQSDGVTLNGSESDFHIA